ncbi:MAG: protein kinase [Chloroflexaceae bacterium]|nr:protein kinase [Chloroflexaceae bacterium]
MLQPDMLIHNRYRIVRSIGQGGMGAVYEALDERLQAVVAVKQTLVTDAQLLKAFEREARLLARLRHPALVNVTDYFSEGADHFLVMEYVPGDNLATLLQQRGAPFPVDTVLDWGDQLLKALAYLHRQEPPIIHRDVKPQNIKLTDENEIILLDFGLAKGFAVTHADAQPTSASIYGYTPQYAPFEQIQGTGTDHRSDLYSLGATLYHLMTGRVPVDTLTRAAAGMNNQPDPLLPASTVRSDVPEAVSQILQQSLALALDARPPSADAMRDAFAAARQGRVFQTRVIPADEGKVAARPLGSAVGAPETVGLPTVPVTTPDTALPPRSGNRLLWGGGALLSLGVVVVLLFSLMRFGTEQPPTNGAGTDDSAVQVAISTEDEPPTSAPAADAPTATPAPPTAVPSAPTPAPPTATPEPPTAVPVTNDPSRYGELDADGQVTVASFPLPDDAAGVQAVFSGGGGLVMYTTARTPEEIADYYREALAPDGGQEVTLLTNLYQGTLSMVFENWAFSNGRVVVVQTVQLDPTTFNVSVRFDNL